MDGLWALVVGALRLCQRGGGLVRRSYSYSSRPRHAARRRPRPSLGWGYFPTLRGHPGSWRIQGILQDSGAEEEQEVTSYSVTPKSGWRECNEGAMGIR